MPAIFRDYLYPAGILSGTIIGAGIFALPFVFQTAGLSTGFFYLVLGSVVYSTVHLMYADIIVRTPGEYRFPGYVRRYLGSGGFYLAVLTSVFQMMLVLTIYLVLSVSFSNLVIHNAASWEKVLIFWILGSAGIFLSIGRLAALEFWITSGIALIIAWLFGMSAPNLPSLSAQNFLPNFQAALFPLAPVLFALSGRVAIASVVKYWEKQHGSLKKLRRIIVGATVFPAVVYGLFAVGVVALSPSVSEDAVTGLAGAISLYALVTIGVLGLLSLFSSYIVVGRDVDEILSYDMKVTRSLRFAMVLGAPILFYAAGLKNFISLISFTGGIFLAMEGILIILMWFAAKNVSRQTSGIFQKAPRVLPILTLVVFAIAFMYEIIRYSF